MPEAPNPAGKLAAYWGVVQAAVAERATTAELWASLRDAAASEGVDLSGISATAVNQMRAAAARNRNAGENLSRATGTDALTGSMIGSELYPRSAADREASPLWLVRFEHSTIADGIEATDWRTSAFSTLPENVGDLRDMVEADGEDMGDEYGATHVGVGAIIITQV